VHTTIDLHKEQHVIGIAIRTTNADEMDPTKGRIPGIWQRFFQEAIMGRIPNKVPHAHPVAVYTDYEDGDTSEYTMIVGCEVVSLDDVPAGMIGVTVPARTYAKFTSNEPGPRGIQDAWRQVREHFTTSSHEARAFIADFEEIGPGEDGAPQAAVCVVLK
jgi:predicted transcriptional regulator YdeE